VSAEPGFPPQTATVTALREARERNATMQRRMLPFGVLALAIVVFTSARARPGIGLHGASLSLSLALCGFTVGLAGVRGTILVERASAPRYRSMLGLLLLSSAALEWVQPTGPGIGGCVLAIAAAVAARVIPARLGIALGALAALFAALVLAGVLGLRDHRHTWSALAVNLVPFAAIFVFALLVWRLREKEEQSARLLIQIEATRGAELRAAALAERQRLARDMHDVLAHSLSGLVLQLEGARLLASADPSDARLAGTIDRAHQLAKNGLDEARRAIGMLRDDELPGPDRLIALARAFEEDTGVKCGFAATGKPRELRSAVKLALYRVTQEALTNVRKHAHPDRVDIRLEYKPSEVNLVVEDFMANRPVEPRAPVSGAEGGITGDRDSGGYGLTGMRERAELLGGTLAAASTSHGFRVLLQVPG